MNKLNINPDPAARLDPGKRIMPDGGIGGRLRGNAPDDPETALETARGALRGRVRKAALIGAAAGAVFGAGLLCGFALATQLGAPRNQTVVR